MTLVTRLATPLPLTLKKLVIGTVEPIWLTKFLSSKIVDWISGGQVDNVRRSKWYCDTVILTGEYHSM